MRPRVQVATPLLTLERFSTLASLCMGTDKAVIDVSRRNKVDIESNIISFS